eukprot:510716_1
MLFTDRFRRLNLIANGTSSKVYKAQDKLTGDILVLKQIPLKEEDDGIPQSAIREIALLKQLQHPNIVRLYDVVHTENSKLTIILEYLDQDLNTHLQTNALPEFSIKSFLFQLLSAINYCHKNRILHRNLEPAHLLINIEHGQLKVSAFRLARTFGIPVRSLKHELNNSVWYRAPDLLMGS